MSGLKVKNNGSEIYADMSSYLSRMQDNLDDKTIKSCLREIGAIFKKHVSSLAPHPSFKKNIKVNVKKSREADSYYVSVQGSGKDGWLWVFYNTGYTDRGGDFHDGTHFVDKAQALGEEEATEVIDRYLKGAIK